MQQVTEKRASYFVMSWHKQYQYGNRANFWGEDNSSTVLCKKWSFVWYM